MAKCGSFISAGLFLVMKHIFTDICVLGGGSGGLSVAAGAVQMGARVTLVEPGPMGGDCLNYGCVPSKALLAAAHHAQAMRDGSAFGVQSVEPTVDMAAVADHIADTIAAIAPHDSVERFESLGVKVIQAKGQFVAPRQVDAGEYRISAKYFVISTGSTAMIPPIAGLDKVDYFTNETLFANREFLPELLILGGGPIGMEMAQAYRRLGSKVTVIEMARCFAKDDPDCADIVQARLLAEGVDILENHRVVEVSQDAQGRIHVCADHDGKEKKISGSHLIVATGRRPVLDDLGLEEAGVAYNARGIVVDARLRTKNRRVFAIGDVIGGLQFTHAAGYHAGIVIRNILFKLPAKADHSAMPWVTYTDPELAHVGETAQAAQARLGVDAVVVTESAFSGNDRAIAERRAEGKIKVVTDRRGVLLGVSIVGAGAGELIMPWQAIIGKKKKISSMAATIAAYPTRSEISKRVAGQYFTPKLFSARVRKIVRLLLKLSYSSPPVK